MSEYLSFYIKKKDGKDFVGVGTFCRSSVIFQAFQHEVPYERIKKINEADIYSVINNLRTNKKQVKKEIIQCKTLANQVTPKSDPNLYFSIVEELTEEKKSIKYYINYLTFLNTVFEDDTELYAGKEIGNPTEEDIVN